MQDLPGTKPCCWSQNKLFTDMWVTIASLIIASNNLKMIEVRLIGRYSYLGLLLSLSCILLLCCPFSSRREGSLHQVIYGVE